MRRRDGGADDVGARLERALKEGSMETWYQTQLDDLQGLITKIRSDLRAYREMRA